MENLLVAIISILIGVAATIFASRHYYRRSVDKELTPFVQLQSNVLSRIDKEVKSDLHIEYKGVKVENLQQLQFLIANTGERAIRNVIRPLRLDLPKDVEIMDASILYVAPQGREVSLNIPETANTIELDFPLLNKDEFFIFKLLLKGAPSRDDLKFTIVADDLPPQLDIQRLTYNQIEKEEKSDQQKFELGFFASGVLILAVALFLGILAHYIKPDSFPAIESESWVWLNVIPIISISSVVGYILAGIFALVGAIMFVVSVFGNFEFPRSKKFRLPKEFATASYGFRGMELEEVMRLREETANKSIQPTAKKAAAD